ncbi:MAG: hypothetical protein ABFD49_01915 [Armatimonadota bacterium]|nr:hypothetical protein [bacterium]
MKNPSKNKLKVIKILDPLLCVRCDHAYIADVVMKEGTRRKMFYCSRLDCDNWVSQTASQVSQDEMDQAA